MFAAFFFFFYFLLDRQAHVSHLQTIYPSDKCYTFDQPITEEEQKHPPLSITGGSTFQNGSQGVSDDYYLKSKMDGITLHC